MGPFKLARATRPGTPTRLADGLGLESTLVVSDLRPEGRLSPAEWFPRSRAESARLGYQLLFYRFPVFLQEFRPQPVETAKTVHEGWATGIVTVTGDSQSALRGLRHDNNVGAGLKPAPQ